MPKKQAGSLIIVVTFIGIFLVLLISNSRNAPNVPVTENTGPTESVESVPDLFDAFGELPQEVTVPPIIPWLNTREEASNTIGTPSSTIEELKEISDKVLSERIIPFRESELLLLPTVPDKELNISPQGIADPMKFLEYYVSYPEHITFDPGKFTNVIKDEDGILMAPIRFVDKALNDNDLASVRYSLSVWKEFTETMLNFERSVAVTGEAASLNKLIIGSELLTLELIDKAEKTADGALKKEVLSDYYEKYRNTVLHYNKQLVRKYVGVDNAFSGNLFSSVLNFFKPDVASAQGLGFGGPIGLRLECQCSLNYLILISNFAAGGAPMQFVVPTVTPVLGIGIAKQDYWTLGIYTPVGACLIGVLPNCLPFGAPEGTVTIIGVAKIL